MSYGSEFHATKDPKTTGREVPRPGERGEGETVTAKSTARGPGEASIAAARKLCAPAALAMVVALGTLSIAALAPRCAAGSALRFDCLANSAGCPEVVIEGDPWPEIPGLGPSPFRGYGDPSIRKAPNGNRLWLSYSFLSLHTEPGDPSIVEGTVGIHLASSDDGGETWQFRRKLWRPRTLSDPAPPGGAGISAHEVSSLTPWISGSRVRWFGMQFQYFIPFGPEGRRPNSMHFRVRRARRPVKLGRPPEARLGGQLTDPVWQLDVNLSTLDPSLAPCSIWTEPSLFGQEGRLFLVAQCLIYDVASGKRRPKQEFVGVFVTEGTGPVDRFDWRWLGKLTTSSDAKTLKGAVLTQAEVTTSRDGSLLLLVTPKRLKPRERHRGCRALELASLDPPRLRRDDAGKPIVRADIRSPDSTGLGPGLCSYDPASSTGILFVRTEIDEVLPEVIFRLHETGIHP